MISTVESAKVRLFRFPLDGSAEHEIATDGSVPLAPIFRGVHGELLYEADIKCFVGF
ncbi:MAG: hypothetical protein JWO19_985 [Bryobacterales bacterium]|nr:hypothetical protein [Bryobacterales bacterium]